jgi:hypothetical protein
VLDNALVDAFGPAVVEPRDRKSAGVFGHAYYTFCNGSPVTQSVTYCKDGLAEGQIVGITYVDNHVSDVVFMNFYV